MDARLVRVIAMLGATTLIASLGNLPARADDTWRELRSEVFGDRVIDPAASGYRMYIEGSAKDAALVPISLRIPAKMVASTSRVHIIIDRNPAPVAAVFTLGEGFRDGDDIGERKIETRIRIDSFSKVRAIFETADGALHMAEKFVAGAGGCSSVNAKNPEEALAQIGRIKVKIKAQPILGENWREAVVMIRHPNFTGMQMDPKSGNYTPAWFVERIDIEKSGKPALSIVGGISLSEDPNIRFTFSSESGETFQVTAIDSMGKRFSKAGEPDGS